MRQFVGRVRELCDSPNLLQDLITMVSAVRLCVWFMLTNIALGIALGSGIMIAAFANQRSVADVGFGQFAAMLIFMALLALLTLLVPIRTAGLIFMPKNGKYLDQIVLSGISPLRYMSGKVVGINLFVLMIIGGALPYLVFSYALGDLSLWYVARGVVLLVIYSNLVCVATLAGATLSQEWANVLGVLTVFGFLCFLGAFPLPPYIAAACPSRFFMEPMYSRMEEIRWFVPSFEVLGLTIRAGVDLCFLSYPFVIFLTSIYLLVGPLNCIALPNSTFGEVIMPGDSKRRSAFRRHKLLQRRSEISFLYENRSEWISRFDLPLRWGTLMLVMLLSGFGPLAAIHIYSKEFESAPFIITSILIITAVCGVAAIILSNDKGGEWTITRFRSLRFRAGLVDTVLFVFFMTFLLTLALVTPFVRFWLSDLAWLSRSKSDEAVRHCLWLLPIIWIFWMWLYALHRSAAMSSWNRAAGIAAAGVVGGMIFLLPILLPYIVTAPRPALPSGVKKAAAIISYISPAPHMIQVLGLGEDMELPDEVTDIHVLGTVMTYLIHSCLLAFFSFLAVRKHRQLNPWGGKQ